MANFGRIELFQDKIVLTDPAINTLQDSSGPTITIDFTNIVSIRLETWLYFNSKIVIEYVDTNQQKTVDLHLVILFRQICSKPSIYILRY